MSTERTLFIIDKYKPHGKKALEAPNEVEMKTKQAICLNLVMKKNKYLIFILNSDTKEMKEKFKNKILRSIFGYNFLNKKIERSHQKGTCILKYE